MRARGGWAALAPLVLVLALAVPVRGPAAEGIRLQLKWVPQAQFAGYYAARARGLYAAEGLGKMLVDVTVGVPDPAALDVDLVRRELPHGEVTVHPVAGGLRVPGSDALIACVAIAVRVEDAREFPR